MVTRACPVCSHPGLEVFFETAQIPIFCNVLFATRDEALQVPRGDLRLGFCPSCAMITNVAFDPDLVAYPEEYETSLHFSPLFSEYATELANRLVERFDLREKDVLEIGCGQGEFLAELCAAGNNRGIGFDASHAPYAVDYPPGVRIIAEDFSADEVGRSADLICCRHVLEHIVEPRPFLDLVRQTAEHEPGTAIFFEVPNGLFTLRDLGIWDLIYEHASYFTAPSIHRLFRDAGLPPRDVYTAFGDQFLCVEASCGGGAPAESADEIAAIHELVGRFQEHFAAKLAEWNDRLADWHASEQRIALWGAGSKGVTFLNTVTGGERVATVVDVNPRKQGRHLPGTGQLVEAPDALPSQPPDVVLVANPIYVDEIRQHCDSLGLGPELHPM